MNTEDPEKLQPHIDPLVQPVMYVAKRPDNLQTPKKSFNLLIALIIFLFLAVSTAGAYYFFSPRNSPESATTWGPHKSEPTPIMSEPAQIISSPAPVLNTVSTGSAQFPSCIPRPKCLEATPPCLMAMPSNGWCPEFASPSAQPTLVGGDKDAYGCLASAGYSWCGIKQKCLRPWEEPCQ